jgi:hypothetical protein
LERKDAHIRYQSPPVSGPASFSCSLCDWHAQGHHDSM